MARVPGGNIRSAISLTQTMRQVISSGKITRADELLFLRAMTSEELLTSEDMTLLNNLMKRMQMGLIKIVDE